MVNEVGGVTDPSSVNIYSLDLEHSIGSGKIPLALQLVIKRSPQINLPITKNLPTH